MHALHACTHIMIPCVQDGLTVRASLPHAEICASYSFPPCIHSIFPLCHDLQSHSQARASSPPPYTPSPDGLRHLAPATVPHSPAFALAMATPTVLLAAQDSSFHDCGTSAAPAPPQFAGVNVGNPSAVARAIRGAAAAQHPPAAAAWPLTRAIAGVAAWLRGTRRGPAAPAALPRANRKRWLTLAWDEPLDRWLQGYCERETVADAAKAATEGEIGATCGDIDGDAGALHHAVSIKAYAGEEDAAHNAPLRGQAAVPAGTLL